VFRYLFWIVQLGTRLPLMLFGVWLYGTLIGLPYLSRALKATLASNIVLLPEALQTTIAIIATVSCLSLFSAVFFHNLRLATVLCAFGHATYTSIPALLRVRHWQVTALILFSLMLIVLIAFLETRILSKATDPIRPRSEVMRRVYLAMLCAAPILMVLAQFAPELSQSPIFVHSARWIALFFVLVPLCLMGDLTVLRALDLGASRRTIAKVLAVGAAVLVVAGAMRYLGVHAERIPQVHTASSSLVALVGIG
jgi:hypothetical protein